MKEPLWIGLNETLTLHDMQLVAFGGSAGVRGIGLLESALARPRNIWHYERKSVSLQRLAAAYAFGIVNDHPFVDGNKRTGLVVAFAFLDLKGVEMKASEEDAYRTFMSLASGKLSEDQLTNWIQLNTR